MADQNNKPSDYPEWATAPASGDVVEPLAAKKAAGYIAYEKPPHNWRNWLLNNIFEWIRHLDQGRLRYFNSLQDLIERIDEGDVGIIKDTVPDGTKDSFTEPTGTFATGVGSGRVIASDGRYFYVADSTTVTAFGCQDQTQAWTVTGFTSLSSVAATDGAGGLFVADTGDGNKMKKIDTDQGTIDPIFADINHGQNIKGMAANGKWLWVVGGTGADNIEVYSSSAGVLNGLETHVVNNDYWTCQCVGDFCYVTSDATDPTEQVMLLEAVVGAISVPATARLTLAPGLPEPGDFEDEFVYHCAQLTEDALWVGGKNSSDQPVWKKFSLRAIYGNNTLSLLDSGFLDLSAGELTPFKDAFYDGRHVYMKNEFGSIYVFDAKTNALLHKMTGDGYIGDTSDGLRFYETPSVANGTVYIWDFLYQPAKWKYVYPTSARYHFFPAGMRAIPVE